MRHRKILPVVAVFALLACCALAARPAPAAAACVGDCDGGGSVSVDEIVRGVNIALGSASLTLCLAIDANGDGQVTVDEIIACVNRALLGCDAEPTPVAATPTATATATATPPAQPTPTGPVVPGCDKGPIVATLTAPVDTNAELSPAVLDLVAAGTVRNPANGLHLWSITGNTCGSDAGLARSVQIQVIGPRTGFAPGRYALTPPLSYLRYLQTPDTGVPQPQIWDGAATTLVIDAVAGDVLSFHVEPTTMTPNLVVAGDPKPRGTFTLAIEGTVRGFTAQ